MHIVQRKETPVGRIVPESPAGIEGAVRASTSQEPSLEPLTPRFPGLPSTVDGSGAVVWVESHISQGACAYPITPSTPMGDGFAVESRTFPLIVYDPRKGERIREGLSLQGNSAMKEDWYTDPKTGQPLDFVTFARTEGRFARHFDDQGHPDAFLLEAQRDRLASWHRLQELAGLR